MSRYDLIALDDRCTVVSEYIPETERSDAYPSEGRADHAAHPEGAEPAPMSYYERCSGLL